MVPLIANCKMLQSLSCRKDPEIAVKSGHPVNDFLVNTRTLPKEHTMCDNLTYKWSSASHDIQYILCIRITSLNTRLLKASGPEDIVESPLAAQDHYGRLNQL